MNLRLNIASLEVTADTADEGLEKSERFRIPAASLMKTILISAETGKPAISLRQRAFLVAGARFELTTFRL